MGQLDLLTILELHWKTCANCYHCQQRAFFKQRGTMGTTLVDNLCIQTYTTESLTPLVLVDWYFLHMWTCEIQLTAKIPNKLGLVDYLVVIIRLFVFVQIKLNLPPVGVTTSEDINVLKRLAENRIIVVYKNRACTSLILFLLKFIF